MSMFPSDLVVVEGIKTGTHVHGECVPVVLWLREWEESKAELMLQHHLFQLCPVRMAYPKSFSYVQVCGVAPISIRSGSPII